MYYADIYEYNPQKIYNIGDMVIYTKNYYICQTTPEGKDYVTGEWDYQYWELYVDTVYKSYSKYNLKKFLEYRKPYDYKNISRYSKTLRIVDDDTGTVYHETINKYILKESTDDKYITVEDTEKDRLDIIANKMYGNPTLWWVIAIANNMVDSFNVPSGTVLRVPPINNLYKDGNMLS